VARDRYRRLEEALDARLGHVRVAVEAVYHRHNVAAILRTCDAMGVHHVHLVEGRIPPAKAPARGAERWLELHRHANPAEAVAELRGAGFDLWVADLSDDAVPPEEIPLDRPVCLWVGAELAGVSPVARAAATGVVTVPMRGLAQSLNVGVATAMCLRPLAEAARRREGALLPRAERDAVWAAWLDREEEDRAAP
jgi:tRNA (guanosine-2'-O-)-methyltransferase